VLLQGEPQLLLDAHLADPRPAGRLDDGDFAGGLGLDLGHPGPAPGALLQLEGRRVAEAGAEVVEEAASAPPGTSTWSASSASDGETTGEPPSA
jgi:hypothetical protein